MTTLKLEFIERQRIPAAAIAFLLVAASACAWILGQVNGLHSQLVHQQEQVRALEKRVDERRLQFQQRNEVPDSKLQQIAAANNMRHLLNYSWNGVFSTIEENRPSEVTIYSFTHDQNRGTTELAVEASDLFQIAELAKAMNAGLDKQQFYVASYQILAQAQKPVVRAKLVQKR